MNVCSSCFLDKELIGFISTRDEVGDCFVCGSKKQKLLDISELFDFFEELLENFKPHETGIDLDVKIQSDWSFFSSNEVARKILDFVIANVSSSFSKSNDLATYADDILENVGHWEKLKEELKWKNRFVIDISRLGKDEFNWDAFLLDINTVFNLSSEVELYRARIHKRSGMDVYPIKEMGCPERENTTAGRANPVGIPVLYLSEDDITVLYEVRAAFLDEVSIGSFSLKKGIGSVQIVDFTKNSPLFQPENVKVTIQGKMLRESISKDLSKPMRRYDSELEYIPTQFICEYIRFFTGAKGIKFKSSLYEKGSNIVFFEPELMECHIVRKVRLTSISLVSQELE